MPCQRGGGGAVKRKISSASTASECTHTCPAARSTAAAACVRIHTACARTRTTYAETRRDSDHAGRLGRIPGLPSDLWLPTVRENRKTHQAEYVIKTGSESSDHSTTPSEEKAQGLCAIMSMARSDSILWCNRYQKDYLLNPEKMTCSNAPCLQV